MAVKSNKTFGPKTVGCQVIKPFAPNGSMAVEGVKIANLTSSQRVDVDQLVELFIRGLARMKTDRVL